MVKTGKDGKPQPSKPAAGMSASGAKPASGPTPMSAKPSSGPTVKK